MVDKQNDVVIYNPKNNTENMKIHIHKPWVRAIVQYRKVLKRPL